MQTTKNAAPSLRVSKTHGKFVASELSERQHCVPGNSFGLLLTEQWPLLLIMQVGNAKEGEINGTNKILSLEEYRKTMIYWGLHSHLQQSS